MIFFQVINGEHLEPFPRELSNGGQGMEAALCKGAGETSSEKFSANPNRIPIFLDLAACRLRQEQQHWFQIQEFTI